MPNTDAAAIGLQRNAGAPVTRDTGAAQRVDAVDAFLAALRLGWFHRQGPASELDAATLAEVADWSAVAALAKRHQASGLLLQALRSQGALLAASGIESALQRRRDRAVQRGFQQLAGLRQALAVLASAGIPCLVLKGLPLSQRLYGHPLLRDAVDIDLLVSPKSFRAAERSLLRNGWRNVSKFRETPVRNRWQAHFVADSRFVGLGGSLELHHRFFDNPHYFDLKFERLSARAASVTIGRTAFPTMAEDDDLLYLMCHGAKHLWTRLKWLCDVALIFANMPAPRLERVAARCREAKLGSILTSTLGLCQDALHVQVQPRVRGGRPRAAKAPAQALDGLSLNGKRTAFPIDASKRSWSKRRPERRFRRQLTKILLLRPNLQALLHGFSTILTTPRDWRRVDLPDPLFPLYVLLRPFLWLEAELKSLFPKNRSLRPLAKDCS